jgi:hypothetical protein
MTRFRAYLWVVIAAGLILPFTAIAQVPPGAAQAAEVGVDIAKGSGFVAALYIFYQALTGRLAQMEKSIEGLANRMTVVSDRVETVAKSQAVLEARHQSLGSK